MKHVEGIIFDRDPFGGGKPRRGLVLICAVALALRAPLFAEPSLPIRAGREAPGFSGQDQDGNRWKLSDHIGKQVVFLYFYPKDDTAGCTAEACGLRDNMVELRQAGVDVVGVSFDGQDSHKNFIFKYNLDFPLLSDTNGAIADAYGARMGEHKDVSSSTFSADEIKDLSGLINRLRGRSDPASAFLWTSFSKSEQSSLASYQPLSPSSRAAEEIVVQEFQKLIVGPGLYKVKRFKGVALRPETIDLIKQGPTGARLVRLNRLLLEDAYPLELSRNQEMDRRISFFIGLDGQIIHVTDSPDPAVHVRELATAMSKLGGKASP